MKLLWEQKEVQDDLRRCINNIFTQGDLAKKYGVSRSTISYQIGKLKTALADEEINRKRVSYNISFANHFCKNSIYM